MLNAQKSQRTYRMRSHKRLLGHQRLTRMWASHKQAPHTALRAREAAPLWGNLHQCLAQRYLFNSAGLQPLGLHTPEVCLEGHADCTSGPFTCTLLALYGELVGHKYNSNVQVPHSLQCSCIVQVAKNYVKWILPISWYTGNSPPLLISRQLAYPGNHLYVYIYGSWYPSQYGWLAAAVKSLQHCC